MNEKKKPGFGAGIGAGIGIGILSGVLACILFAVLFVNVYSMISGKYLVLGGHGVSAVEDHQVVDDATADKITEISQYLDAYYYEDYDIEDVRNSLLDGMVAGLDDPYTVYYTPEEYQSLQVSITGTYYGIGAGLSQDAKTMEVTISKVYEGTPAEEAGLRKDDQIISVDGTQANSMEVTQLVQLIRGEEGTTVHLEIYRASDLSNFSVDVERRNVQLPSVAGEMLDGNIGYIQISEWQTNTPQQFNETVATLQEQGMQSMIIDVRDNPGGLLSSVSEVLDTILPEGTIVYTEDKYGNRTTLTSDANCMNYPMVVLINGNSASASEIFAGAIKDYNYGTLLGTTTFGKGIVQTTFPLKDGDALKITTAKYFTPNGVNIHGTGIDPDVELEYEFLGPEDGTYEKQYDNQLQEAIKILTDEVWK